MGAATGLCLESACLTCGTRPGTAGSLSSPLFAIGRELERRGSLVPFEQIDLAVGLPPEHYGMLRDKFAQYFRRGVVKFTYKEQPVHLDIRRVLVYPQAYAAVIPQSGQLLKTSRCLLWT